MLNSYIRTKSSLAGSVTSRITIGRLRPQVPPSISQVCLDFLHRVEWPLAPAFKFGVVGADIFEIVAERLLKEVVHAPLAVTRPLLEIGQVRRLDLYRNARRLLVHRRTILPNAPACQPG